MKSITATSLLIGAAFAQSTTFDAASAFSTLATQAGTIQSDAQAYTGGSASTLQSASDTTLSLISQYDTSAKSSLPFDTATAAGLITPVNNLASAVEAAINAIIAKKATLVQNCQGSKVYSAIAQQSAASKQLSNDVVKLVPSALQSTAQNLAEPIDAAFASGVAAFEGVSACTASSSAASSATAASSSSGMASSATSTMASSIATSMASSSMPSSMMSSSLSSVTSGVSSASGSATSSGSAVATTTMMNGTTTSASSTMTSVSVATGAAATNVISSGVAAGLALAGVLLL